MSQQQQCHLINSNRRLDMNPFPADEYSNQIVGGQGLYPLLWLHALLFIHTNGSLKIVPLLLFPCHSLPFNFEFIRYETLHFYKIENCFLWKQQNVLMNNKDNQFQPPSSNIQAEVWEKRRKITVPSVSGVHKLLNQWHGIVLCKNMWSLNQWYIFFFVFFPPCLK